jgi:hypothetical protein
MLAALVGPAAVVVPSLTVALPSCLPFDLIDRIEGI